MTSLAAALIAPPAPAGQADPVAVVITVGVLILVVVGAGIAVLFIRRRLLSRHDPKADAASFLDELRDLHRRGEVSDAEFQAARASLLAKATGASVPQAPRPIPRPQPHAAPQARVAPPGFDLTGAPLPRPIGEGPSPPPDTR